MKIILSRKGFDSSSGGYPSPILPDGRLLSLPIPAKNELTYNDIFIDEKTSYYELMRNLKSKIKLNGRWKELTPEIRCHLDPDLIISTTNKRLPCWKPMFGQVGISQKHLRDNLVKENDIFLFYGLFQKTVYDGNRIRFDKRSKPIHCIWGYLQIGEIIQVNGNNNLHKWMIHPHNEPNFITKKYNTIYIARSFLTFNTQLKGAGIFKLSNSLILTKEGYSASKWELPQSFKRVNITYHKANSKYGWKNDYFQSACRGQEFIIDEDNEIESWAKSIIEKHNPIQLL